MTAHTVQGGRAMDLSGGEIAGLVLGPTGLGTGIWAVVKWMTANWQAREKYVDQRVQAYVATLETQIATLKSDNAAALALSREDGRRREGRIARLEAVTQMLLLEVAKHDPQSGALRRASELLNIAYPLPAAGNPDRIADLMDDPRINDPDAGK